MVVLLWNESLLGVDEVVMPNLWPITEVSGRCCHWNCSKSHLHSSPDKASCYLQPTRNMLSFTPKRVPSLIRTRLLPSNTPPSLRYTTQTDNPVPANPGRNTPQRNSPVSATNELPTSSEGSHDRALQESVEQGEEIRTMQAPNRKGIWSRSQQPREKAMVGPRFEQMIMADQVGFNCSFLELLGTLVGYCNKDNGMAGSFRRLVLTGFPIATTLCGD